MLLHYFVQGLKDGWNGERTMFTDSEPPKDESILEEIETLKTIIDRQKEIGSILDKQLQHTNDQKKKAILLNKLNVLDKQTLTNTHKLNKLLDGYQ